MIVQRPYILPRLLANNLRPHGDQLAQHLSMDILVVGHPCAQLGLQGQSCFLMVNGLASSGHDVGCVHVCVEGPNALGDNPMPPDAVRE